jgi:pyruvate formate lyase activating enzyme
MKSLGIWLEITTLLVPGHADDDESLKAIAAFIRDELGPETPWHISRFFPNHQFLDLPPTALERLSRARQIGLSAGLRYVYTGNVPGDSGEHTYCHACGELLIERFGFQIHRTAMRNGHCPACGTAVDGLGLA